MQTPNKEEIEARGDKVQSQWAKVIQDLLMGMLMTSLHDNVEILNKLKQTAIFELHQLNEII